jgi:hypothetical protein
MPPRDAQTSEAQRLESLRQARQRIVELQAVRTYLQESGNAAALLADLDVRLAEALALEQALIKQGAPHAAGSRAGRASPLIVAVVTLGATAEDTLLAALQLACTVSFPI